MGPPIDSSGIAPREGRCAFGKRSFRKNASTRACPNDGKLPNDTWLEPSGPFNQQPHTPASVCCVRKSIQTFTALLNSCVSVLSRKTYCPFACGTPILLDFAN